jgi:hypothetical protein
MHDFQLTSFWAIHPRSRRFGRDAELCGCAVLADNQRIMLQLGKS